MLTRKVVSMLRQNTSINVIIAGGTCSGKSTLANNTKSQLSNQYSIAVVRQDDYFKDLKDITRSREGYLFDSLSAFHVDEFRQDVRELIEKGQTVVPRYEIALNRRIAKDVNIQCSQINIIEGLHTILLLKDVIRGHTIFLDTSIRVCLERRIKRDTNMLGICEGRVMEFFYNCILPMYQQYILPQKGMANEVIS